MSWTDCQLLGLIFLLFGGRWVASRVPPHWWYVSPSKRRAMRLALLAAELLQRPELDWAGCRIFRRDADKCFVCLQHRGVVRPESYSVFVVWRGADRVDDLGTWQFHWGIRPGHAVRVYEDSRKAGVPWPVGLGEALRWPNPTRVDGKPSPLID